MCFALQRWKDSDRAREIYKAATQEKLALIRFWHQKTRESAEMTDQDRKECTEWLQSLNLLKEKLQDDLQSILSGFKTILAAQAESKDGMAHVVQRIEPCFEQMTSALVLDFETTMQQYSEGLSAQAANQLHQLVERHEGHLEKAMQQHFSKAIASMERGLARPAEAVHQATVTLGSHIEALELVLQNQHGLVTDLSSTSADLMSRQQLHEKHIIRELEALRRLQIEFKTIERGLNASHGSLDTILNSQRYSTSFRLLSSAVFAIERLFFWSLGEFERKSGVDVGNTAWRCLRWLLLTWPAALKIKATVMYAASILQPVTAALVLLAMLVKSLIQPVYGRILHPFRSRIAPRRRVDSTDSSTRAQDSGGVDASTQPTKIHVKEEPQMDDSWCLLPTSSRRYTIPSRCGTPHEVRMSLAQRNPLLSRRSRIQSSCAF
ncbi:hypothetical protein PSEUBRA_002364 [Kalmanozyma brasiliensis GHG001]|uniref:uncharacterized protein n=1 Tax=Kalmanozyma brasiliensis (strain GHG001) TaxID=1365824 RepID=UPI001CE7F334|nr:uncharacterized protein PSEUBRA_002364 [Kalmanozyma brasiliensis GHG001]EST07978.2 hypothetical protein PSEUBRA_002364 [Kalmanozyma brasiliensis GHG001]